MQEKNRRNLSKFVIIFLGILSPSFIFFGLLKGPIYSATSDTVNLQGKIVRNDPGYEGLNVTAGNPSCVVTGAGNDTCDFRIRYYDASTAGNLLLTEQFSNIEIGQYLGVFNLSLGSDPAPVAGVYTSLSGLIQGEDDVYVEVSFDPSGLSTYTEVFSRMPLEATGYAIRAKHADTATGATELAWSGLKDPTGDLTLQHSTRKTLFNWATGTGTNDLFSLTSDASANGTGVLLNVQTGTGASLMPLRVRAGSVEGLMVDNQGRVGVGTASPREKLDVEGNINTTGRIYVGSSSGSVTMASETGGVTDPWSGDTNYTRPLSLHGNFSLNSALSGGVYYQNQYSGAWASYFRWSRSSDDGTQRIAELRGNDFDQHFSLYDGTTNTVDVRLSGTGDSYIREGNVGIGTTSPTSLLSVGSSSQFQVNSSGDIVKLKNLTYSWPSSHTTNGFLKDDGSGNLTWTSITGVGGVAGTGVAGQATFWTGTSTVSGDNAFWWDNTNKRLGIGTTTPSTQLHTTGGVRFAGLVADTQTTAVMTDTNGNLSTRALGSLAFEDSVTGDNWGTQVVQSDNTLTGTGVTGSLLGLNLANANTWTGSQTFSANTYLPGSGIWNSSGKVGIGTSAPSYLLDVSGGTGIVAQFGGRVIGGDAVNTNEFVTKSQLDSVAGTAPSFADLTSGTNTSATMTVDTGASLDFVNLGTINASSLLSGTWAVPGAIGSITPNSGAFTTVSGTSGSFTTLSASTSVTTPLVIGTSDTLMLRPTINATNAIRLANATGTAILSVDTANSRVGVGTIFPDSALHVAGQVKIVDGNQGNGRVLTSDINGLASWAKLTSLGGIISVIGTANQINASTTAGEVTLSIPTDFRAPGTVNAVSGIYTGATAGTQRIDASGNLVNIGDITFTAAGVTLDTDSLSPNILSLASGDSFNLVSGSLRVGGTEVITSGRLIRAANGSATTPAFSFSADDNTGMYSGGTDILKFATAGADRVTILADGKMGVGTTSPGKSLDVAGDIRLRGDAATLNFYRNTSPTDIAYIKYDEVGASFDIATNNRDIRFLSGLNWVESMRITSGGYVGIGTSSPVSLFSVGATSQFQVDTSGDITKIKNLSYTWPTAHTTDGYLKNNGTGGLSWAEVNAVQATGTPYGSATEGPLAFWTGPSTIAAPTPYGLYWDDINQYLGIGTNTPSAPLDIAGGTGGSLIKNSSGDITIEPAANLIISQGDVGIGTKNPLAKLHVMGNQIILKNEANADVGFVLDSGSTTTYRDVITFRDRGTDIFALEKTSTNAFQLYDYAGTGVSRILVEAGGNSGISMRTTGTGDFSFINDTTTRVTIKSDGKVGIGTASPYYTLDVSGNARISTLGSGSTNTVVTHSSGVLQTRTIDSRVWGSSLVDGSGTASYTARWTDGNTLGIGVLYDNGTNVGVGTTSPSALLEVGTPSSGSTVRFSNPASGNPTMMLGRVTGQPSIKATSSSDWVIIDGGQVGLNYWQSSNVILANGGGNVGIGTTSPSSFKLQIAGSIGPNASASYNLGSSSLKWNDIYTAGTTYIGNGTTYYSGDVGGNAKFSRIALGGGAVSSNYALRISGSTAVIALDGSWNAAPASGSNEVYSQGIEVGTGDGATKTVNNLAIKSWYGIGFWNTVAGGGRTDAATIWFNVRTGSAYAQGTWNANQGDLAEVMTKNPQEEILPGDIVQVSSEQGKNITIADEPYSSKIIGVISTAPGFAMSSDNGDETKGILSDEDNPEKAFVGLVGKIPVKVSLSNGQINNGDAITASPLSGYGMKASKAGTVVGKALESTNNWNTLNCPAVDNYDSIQWPEDDGKNPSKPCYRLPDGTYVGKIMVFVNVSWYDPKPGELLERIEGIEAQLDALNTEGASMLSIESNIVAAVNNTYDLGTNKNRWKDIYAQGTINLGNATDNGGIKYDTETKRLTFTNDGQNWIPLGPPKKSVLLSVQYPGSVILDNTDVKGTMTTNSSGVDNNSMNYYEWVSSKSALNTNKIKIRYQIPSDFKQWGDGGITFKYATQSTNTENNKLDFYVYDQASSVPETISLNHVSSVEEKWESVEVLGLPFNKCSTPGDVCIFVIEMSSSKDYYTRVGDIEIKYERNL